MATRSNIAYKTAEGKIRAAYCHYDGYTSNNGEILRRFYTDADKVKTLVDLGSMSFLAAKVFPTKPGHSFDTPEAGVVVFYNRDRGEGWDITSWKEYDDFAEYVADGEEYMYFFNGTDWLVNDHGETDDNGNAVFDYVDTVINPSIVDQLFGE